VRELQDYMLLCSECNRAKSWACEHCENWQTHKQAETCATCYWAQPQSYQHIAMQLARRLDLTWRGDKVGVYEHFRRLAEADQESLQHYLKRLLKSLADS
jgi:hypothetical protein